MQGGGWLNNLCMAVAFASGARPEVSGELERRAGYEVEESKGKRESGRISWKLSWFVTTSI